MPHAEKNLLHHVHDSSVEPCLKKSRPDYSSSWAKTDTDLYKEHEAKSQKWSFSTVSEERSHQSHRCESEDGRGDINVKYDSESSSESLRYLLGQGDANKRDCNKTSQHPFVLPRREKPEYNSDVTFSGTSTSFIGPQYPPSPRKKPVPKVRSNPNANPSFKIATVELGKLASHSKGKDGMDYELRQFYKELNELEAEADDPTKQVTRTDVDVKQHISPYPDKLPARHGSNHHHGQVPTSQPIGPFPGTPSNPVSLTYHVRGEPRPQLERPPLPHNDQFSCDGQAPYHPTNSLFGSHAMPPPRFEGHHPPTFIVPYGPPPPRFNYPRQSNILPPQPFQNFNYSTRNEHPPWHGSPVPPESWFLSQGIPYIKPFSQGTGERTWQDLQHNDSCRPEDGQFGERILPHMGNVSHEQCLGRLRDKRKMVLLRGVPGSGKSTLARTLLQQSPDGVVLSTDDYFCQENGYTYDVKLLGDAHSWNQNRARRVLDDGRSPVIIDNTNIQAWEMKTYVQMAVDRGYDIEFLEPDTWWKQDAHELEKRNTHRVSREKISQMLERYEHGMTVPVVMNSVEPRRNRPNRPPPEARPRTNTLKKKRHRKRYRKNVTNRKDSLSFEEDKGLENLAVEETGRGYNVGNCMIDAEEIGKVQVKIIYSGKEGYLSNSLAAFLSQRSNLTIAALFGLVVRPMHNPITQPIPKTEFLDTYRQYMLCSSLLSLVMGRMLYKGTNCLRPFFSWLQACSKGLPVTDQAHSSGQDIINASLELYCSLINFFAGQTLHLYGMKCFELEDLNYPKNRLAFRVSENQDEKSKQEYLERERFKDPYLDPENSKHECVQIMDRTNVHVKTKQSTPGHHKRHRKIYKLAPTFQHPRILSATQISTWKNGCGDGANNLYTETDETLAMQNSLEDHDIIKLVPDKCKDDLTRRDARCRAKDASGCKYDFYPITSECSDDHASSVVTRSYSSFRPGATSCAGLCLPEQFARQLVELFGCPGVELDAFEPKDFIVPLGCDLAQRIYLKWKKSLEAKYTCLPAK